MCIEVYNVLAHESMLQWNGVELCGRQKFYGSNHGSQTNCYKIGSLKNKSTSKDKSICNTVFHVPL